MPRMLRNMKTYPHIASRILNTPLMIHPAKLDAIIAGIGDRLLGAKFEIADSHEEPGMFVSSRGEVSASQDYRIVDGIAVIDVSGALAHKGRMDANCTYVQGYQDVARAFDAAMADTNVSGILFVFDTPGGEVAGAFDLASKIHSARMSGAKPIAGVASDMAASAGYLLAAAVGELAVSQTAVVGSVGVVMRHVDMSAALQQDGFKVTFIHAGAHKVDGNQFEPLPDAVRSDFQANINTLYSMFIEAVSAYRPGITTEALLATEARVYTGKAAVDAGLADRIATPDEMIQDLRSRVSGIRSSRAGARATHSNRSQSMSVEENGQGASARPEAGITQADLDRARAEGHAEGVKAGMTQERERVSAIMGHAEAEGRSTLAQTCVSQGLSAEASAAVLASSPKSAAPAAGNQFADHMAAIGNPAVKPDAGTEGEGADASSFINSMVAMINGPAKQ